VIDARPLRNSGVFRKTVWWFAEEALERPLTGSTGGSLSCGGFEWGTMTDIRLSRGSGVFCYRVPR
jgi:hypothetical protein